TKEQHDQFSLLASEFIAWNNQINMVSRKDTDYLLERHILHSLSLQFVVNFSSYKHVLDIGTGGGFPGIPLAIMFPETQFYLVDSIGKKIRVVQELTQSLGLHNVIATQQRAESFSEKVDLIVSRAVARTAKLEAWSKGKFKGKPRFAFLKGGDLREEVEEAQLHYSISPIHQYINLPFFETKAIVHYNVSTS
ncbi:MAG TPA: 16S rRNA (guanine(527)-N(7))-methyltransferase RsmG, partial [Bacteroidetes bacterium]|nr:16S rRNA (guanine(527)-N(7))-methyltransferase RsmG [Bacteroidota bacterium]